MYIIYEKSNGAVVMTSSGKNIINKKFIQTSIALKSGDKEKLESNNYDVFVKGKKLVFKEKLHFKKEKEKSQLIKDIENANDVSKLKNIMKKMYGNL